MPLSLWRWIAALTAMFFALPVLASEPIEVDDGAVARRIGTATEEILVASGTLRSHAIADALRIAMVQRGVRVFVLSTPHDVAENSSYWVGLAYAGANVRLVSELPVAFVVVDRTSSFYGPAVGDFTYADRTEPTVRSDDATYVLRVVDAFVRSFDIAIPYELPY